jgi:hypothetical protein
MENIAIKLDTAIKPTGNWKKLARQLEVPREIFEKFEMYSDYNPTISLVRYLYVTSKEPIPLKVFMDYFNEMNRQDVISMAMKVIKSDEKGKMRNSTFLTKIYTCIQFVRLLVVPGSMSL